MRHEILNNAELLIIVANRKKETLHQDNIRLYLNPYIKIMQNKKNAVTH